MMLTLCKYHVVFEVQGNSRSDAFSFTPQVWEVWRQYFTESPQFCSVPCPTFFLAVMGKPLSDILFHWWLAYQLSNNTLLNALIDCWHKNDAFEVVPYARPCIELFNMFMAGSETTAKALSWAMYYLAKHPEMLSRCREEALRAAPLRYRCFILFVTKSTSILPTVQGVCTLALAFVFKMGSGTSSISRTRDQGVGSPFPMCNVPNFFT